MRKYYQRRLPSDPSKDYYFIHRETGKTQPILVEYGFLDSTGDDVSQLKNNFLDYVEAVVRAVAEYTNTPYIPPEGVNIYTVQKGDSLYSIASKFDITVDELKAANNLTSNILNIGQILTIPTKKEEVTPGEYEVYTVKSGDSLWSIATQYDVSVDSIIELNNLGTTMLKIGQQLLIPKQNVSIEDEYIVKAGDSLYSIANKYGITVNDLKSTNNLTSNNLSIGQKLVIPGLKQEPEIPQQNEITYIVQKGDSLWSIAKKYGITVNGLKEYNNLTTNSLAINQKLSIPKTEDYTSYTVKSGDNLYKIANNFNTTISELKKVNNLTNDTLSIGQILIIPS